MLIRLRGRRGVPCESFCNAFAKASALVVGQVEGFPRRRFSKAVAVLSRRLAPSLLRLPKLRKRLSKIHPKIALLPDQKS